MLKRQKLSEKQLRINILLPTGKRQQAKDWVREKKLAGHTGQSFKNLLRASKLFG